MILQTEGIVLKSFDFRETSRIATFFTKDYGKVKGVLKGIRTDPKKFGSSLEQGTVNNIVYYQYRHSDLHLISHCDLKEFFPIIRQDFRKTMAASYMAELVDKIMPTEEKNALIYHLLNGYLHSLEITKEVTTLVRLLQIKILMHSGFKPHLDNCLRCGWKISQEAKFSLTEGGLLCSPCAVSEGPNQYNISQGTIATLLHVENNSWEKCQCLTFTSTVAQELKYILNNFLVFHLGKRIQSARFITA